MVTSMAVKGLHNLDILFPENQGFCVSPRTKEEEYDPDNEKVIQGDFSDIEKMFLTGVASVPKNEKKKPTFVVLPKIVQILEHATPPVTIAEPVAEIVEDLVAELVEVEVISSVDSAEASMKASVVQSRPLLIPWDEHNPTCKCGRRAVRANLCRGCWLKLIKGLSREIFHTNKGPDLSGPFILTKMIADDIMNPIL